MGSIDALWTAKGIKALTWLQTPQFRQGLTSSIALRLRVHFLDGSVNVHFRTMHIDCTASNDTLVHAPHSRRTFAANRSVQPRAPNPLAAVPDRDSLSCPSAVQSRMRQVNERVRIKIECTFSSVELGSITCTSTSSTSSWCG